MKKIFWMTFVGFGAALLGGCPIYPDNGSQRVCDPNVDFCSTTYPCSTNSDCGNGFACYSGQCVASSSGYDAGADATTLPNSCTRTSDCPAGENCGANNQCAPGDCSNNGCPTGLVCKLSGGQLNCVSPNGTPPDSGTDSGVDAGVDSGNNFTGCQNDNACGDAGVGAKCIDGVCITAANQCSDATQCPNSERCVSGVCTASCSSTIACPAGYSCDTNGVCSGNPTPCGAAGEVCAANTTCVDQHCVTPCGAGNSCPTGLICVDDGCIPDQKPQFVCQTDGQPGDGMVGNCAGGSICLHHNCYISCNPDAGAGACTTADQFNQCKQVTTSTGTYSVCGSSTNLGSACDPTQGKQCVDTTKVCIDGNCY